AITGSMNQKGMVQPIGGVNEKIEGFYKVCKQQGLNGRQGVVIPIQNKDNLMLNDDVIQAVKEGEFYIYSVETIDQAIEIMMGKPAEEVHDKVREVLSDFADKAADYDTDVEDSE
ncbi:MAG: S16 family serine protease, partial [Halanaerobiales bacterium]